MNNNPLIHFIRRFHLMLVYPCHVDILTHRRETAGDESWRLCRSRHSRHYLPFLTMSGNLSASTDVAGFYRLQGLDRLTVTQHSFLVPTDRCSGWSPG